MILKMMWQWLKTLLLEKRSPAAGVSKAVWDQTVDSSFLWPVGLGRGDFHFFLLYEFQMEPQEQQGKGWAGAL